MRRGLLYCGLSMHSNRASTSHLLPYSEKLLGLCFELGVAQQHTACLVWAIGSHHQLLLNERVFTPESSLHRWGLDQTRCPGNEDKTDRRILRQKVGVWWPGLSNGEASAPQKLSMFIIYR